MWDNQESEIPNICAYSTRKGQKYCLTKVSVKLIRNFQFLGVYDLTELFVKFVKLLSIYVLLFLILYINLFADLLRKYMLVYLYIYCKFIYNRCTNIQRAIFSVNAQNIFSCVII